MPGKPREMSRPRTQATSGAANAYAVLSALSGAMAVLVLSPAGMILAANDNFLTLTNQGSRNLIHTPYRALFPEDAQTGFDALWEQVALGQLPARCVAYQRPDGALVWLDAIFVPVFNSDQTLAQLIVLQSDATARVIQTQQERHYLDLLSLSINGTDNAIIIMDSSNRIVFQNASFTRMLGYRPEETIGRRPSDIFYTQPSIMGMLEEFSAALARGQSHHAEARIQDGQNRPAWISIIVNPIFNDCQALVNAVCIFTDITTLKMQEILQYKAFNTMARDVGLQETLALVCQEIDEITPEILSSVHQLDATQQWQSLAGPSLPVPYHDIAKTLMARPGHTSSHTTFIEQKVPFIELELDPLWENYKHRFVPTGLCAVWMTLIHAASGQAIGLLVFYCFEEQRPTPFHQQLIDLVTPICALALERETTRSRIEKLAYYDSLTGLANRSRLTSLATEAIAKAAITETTLAVLFIDLDRFKQINDSLGHHAGDELLRTIAARLSSVARQSDIVGRLSGDEFSVVLTHCARDKLTEIATRFQHTLAMTCHINGVPINPSASIGISIYPDHGNTIDTLLHRADLAMYAAKEKQRGSFGFFSEDMNAQTQDRLAMEAALRHALNNQALYLHYQPQVYLQEHRLYGVEALARWQHPQWGHIPPDRFVALAEECGLIGELTQWVLDAACRQLADWRSRHIHVPCIAVNLSASNFHDPALCRNIAKLLEKYHLSPQDITLEITETVLMDTNPDTSKNILDIHALGIRIAIDDFGTGYSSLGYLRNLPVSELKLDQSFVRDIEDDPTVLALANAVIRIGESLGLTVIAEGVENTAQRNLLINSHCDVAQGYLFSRPVGPDAFEQWLRAFEAGQHDFGQTAQSRLF